MWRKPKRNSRNGERPTSSIRTTMPATPSSRWIARIIGRRLRWTDGKRSFNGSENISADPSGGRHSRTHSCHYSGARAPFSAAAPFFLDLPPPCVYFLLAHGLSTFPQLRWSLDPRLYRSPRPGFGAVAILDTQIGRGRIACPYRRSLFSTDHPRRERRILLWRAINRTTSTRFPWLRSIAISCNPASRWHRDPRWDDGLRGPDGEHRARGCSFPPPPSEDPAMLTGSKEQEKVT